MWRPWMPVAPDPPAPGYDRWVEQERRAKGVAAAGPDLAPVAQSAALGRQPGARADGVLERHQALVERVAELPRERPVGPRVRPVAEARAVGRAVGGRRDVGLPHHPPDVVLA